MPTGVKDVITFAGSFLGGSLFSPEKNKKTASLTASMIDKGTQEKDKYIISDTLESVGAELSFSTTKYHAHFTGHCLKEDLEIVIQLLSEQLQSPVFSEEELAILKTRTIGNLEQAKEDTKQQAMVGLLRMLYPPNHPNYKSTTDEVINQVSSVSTKDLNDFHQKHYGLGGVSFVAVGDVDTEKTNNLLGKYFAGWDTKNPKNDYSGLKAKSIKKGKKETHIPEKTSMDVYFGQAVGISQDHKDYYPLMMGVYILGGNFSARLMQTVRDQQGLTYGIGSSLAGVDFGSDGYWSTGGTFAPDLLEAGKKATMDQIIKWHKDGVTQGEVDAKKSTITGSYQVGMDSTGGLTAQILSNVEKGRSVDFLDLYPDIIRGVSLDQINNAIRTYIDPKKLTVVSAGTFKDS